MASWLSFLVALAFLVVALLVLTHSSTQMLQSALESTSSDTTTAHPSESASTDTAVESTTETPEARSSLSSNLDEHSSSTDSLNAESPSSLTLSTPTLWVNVVITQSLFGLVLAAIVWYTDVPVAAFGISAEYRSAAAVVATGVAVGVVFYAISELTMRAVQRLGTDPPAALREALAPDTLGGWAVLLFVVLPVIAVFEELLFRGAMIGALSVGFSVPVWLLAVVSSVAFGLGHSAQGRVGIVVTSVLGLGLAGVFVWTESLAVVIVAHYVLNAAEFVVHEGFNTD